MKVKYIAIEREYGSGGTKIAEGVAKQCGISCYGKEVLEMAAQKLHISVEEAEKYEEQASNSFLYSMYMMSQTRNGNNETLPMECKLYVEEHNAIAQLAKHGKAVFVGHCAAEALKDEKGVVKVFVRASEESRRKRAIEEYNIVEKEVAGVCKRFDKKRATYYGFNTGKKWDDYSNYDIVLDSTELGIEGCVKMLASLMQ